jgi:hypothetical protein
MKSRESMIRYLLKNTRYTEAELNKKSDTTIEKWYKEEKQTNAE